MNDPNNQLQTATPPPAKKPFYKRWWFFVLIAALIIIIFVVAVGGDSTDEPPQNDDTQQSDAGSNNNSDQSSNKQETTYEKMDLQAMLDELESNALRAEQTYQNKYVEITGKIYSFDSDGAYISIEPVGADEWNFDTVMCYIKTEEQKEFLLTKSKGDRVTIKGKITSIGEFLGYSINIDQVN